MCNAWKSYNNDLIEPELLFDIYKSNVIWRKKRGKVIKRYTNCNDCQHDLGYCPLLFIYFSRMRLDDISALRRKQQPSTSSDVAFKWHMKQSFSDMEWRRIEGMVSAEKAVKVKLHSLLSPDHLRFLPGAGRINTSQFPVGNCFYWSYRLRWGEVLKDCEVYEGVVEVKERRGLCQTWPVTSMTPISGQFLISLSLSVSRVKQPIKAREKDQM